MVNRTLFGAVLFVSLALPALPVMAGACAELGVDCSHSNAGSRPSGGGGGSYGGPAGGGILDQNLLNIPFWALERTFNALSGSHSSSPSPGNGLNDQGLAAIKKGDWASAEVFFKQSLARDPNNPVIRRNLALTQNHLGIEASKQGNYALAINYEQQALANVPANDPGIPIIKGNISDAQSQIDEAKVADEQRRQDKIAAANMQQSIQGLAQSMSAAPPSGGLDFSDGTSGNAKVAKNGGDSSGLGFMDSNAVSDTSPNNDVATGTFGEKVVNHNMKTVPHSKVGTNTKAGDELVSAAAGGDLTHNYDIGDAKYKGSLANPSGYVRDQSLNPATFTEKERNAPGMSKALNDLNDAQTKRSQLDAERNKTIAERDREKDPKRFAELDHKVDQETKTYAISVQKVSSEEAKVIAIKKHIPTEVGAAPGATASAKQ